MKICTKKILSSFLILPLSILLAFCARILSLHVLSTLFKAINLTEITLPYAPLWAQRLAAVSGSIADFLFLLVLVIPMILYCGKAGKGQKKLYLYMASGLLFGAFLMSVLLLTGSVRMSKVRTFPFPGAFALYVLTDLFSASACAYLCRCVPGKTFGKNPRIRLILSIALQAAYWMPAKSSLSPVLIINSCLLGFLLFLLYEKRGSVLPEILFVFSLRFTVRFLFGYPDLGGAYPVSEPLFTGDAGGLSHSLLLTVCLLSVSCALITRFILARRIPKGVSHVSK